MLLLPGRTSSSLALLLLPGFFLADELAVNFEIGDQAHTAMLTELPLVLGLFTTDARLVVLARVGAGVLALAGRRQTTLKLLFNTSQFAFSATLAALAFAACSPLAAGGTIGQWLTGTAAAVAGSLAGVVAVLAVIRLVQGPIQQAVTQLTIAGVATAFTSSTLAVVCLSFTGRDPWAAALFLALGLMAGALYYGYTRQRSRFQRLRSLYDFLRVMGPAAGGRDVAENVLRRSQELLKAEQASLYLYRDISLLERPGDREERDCDGTVVMLRDGEGLRLEPLILTPELWPVSRAILDGQPLLIRRGTRNSSHAAWIERLGVRDAVLVPLPGDADLHAALLVAGRRPDVGGFTADDLEVLEGLANHAAVALRSGALVDQLLFESRHDPLTGLANRVEFAARLELAAQRAQSTGLEQSVLLMDLDRFKDVNDSLGHHAGDQLLIQLADRLRNVVRPGDTVARLGGDEFAILLPDTDRLIAGGLAEAMRAAIGDGVDLDGVCLETGASIGLAIAPDHGSNAQELMRRADAAMYAAKAGTGVEVYDPSVEDAGAQRLALVSDLRRTLTVPSHAAELRVVFQPQCDTITAAPVGVEALVRWQHPRLGNIPPDVFVPLAESANLIPLLTERVLTDSLRTLARLDGRGHALGMSVNLSARDLLTPSLAEHVRGELTRHGLPADRLTLEITESTWMSDRHRSQATMNKLRGVGVKLSVDDFGTGYSSLSQRIAGAGSQDRQGLRQRHGFRPG